MTITDTADTIVFSPSVYDNVSPPTYGPGEQRFGYYGWEQRDCAPSIECGTNSPIQQVPPGNYTVTGQVITYNITGQVLRIPAPPVTITITP